MTIDQIDASSDEELFALLANELKIKIPQERGSPEFVAQLRELPVGLRAMAATYEFDVSLALDDVGWHFGNWHSQELSEETANGLEELGAAELARVFRESYRIAQEYWTELGAEKWMDWYHGSVFEREIKPLSKEAWAILKGKKCGIFDYWITYARRFPEKVGAVETE